MRLPRANKRQNVFTGSLAFIVVLVLGLTSVYADHNDETKTQKALLTVEKTRTGFSITEKLDDPAYYATFSKYIELEPTKLVGSFGVAQRKRRGALRIVDACSSVVPTTSTGNDPWVALFVRGGCKFVKKAYNGAIAGAAGVIIMDNVEGSDAPRLSGSSDDFEIVETIPVIGVTFDTGKYLVSLLEQNEGIKIGVTLGEVIDAEDEDGKISSTWFLGHIIIFAGTIVFVSVLVLGAYYCRARRVRRETMAEQREAQSVVQRMPTRTFSSLIDLKNIPSPEEAPACAVCLEDFDDGEELRILPCRHEFHADCVDPWLTANHTCPLCKADILGKVEEEPKGPEPRTLNVSLMVNSVDGDDNDNETSTDPPQSSIGEYIAVGDEPTATQTDDEGNRDQPPSYTALHIENISDNASEQDSEQGSEQNSGQDDNGDFIVETTVDGGILL